MKKNYILFFLATLTFFSFQNMNAQNKVINSALQQNIEGLSIYPNPVNSQNPIINIISGQSLIKTIEIFDVLGKHVFSTVLMGKELNISNLRRGIYILKITENKISISRKLVVK